MTLFHFGNLFRRSLTYDLTASKSAFGANIDQPVSRFNNVQVMLDDFSNFRFQRERTAI